MQWVHRQRLSLGPEAEATDRHEFDGLIWPFKTRSAPERKSILLGNLARLAVVQCPSSLLGSRSTATVDLSIVRTAVSMILHYELVTVPSTMVVGNGVPMDTHTAG